MPVLNRLNQSVFFISFITSVMVFSWYMQTQLFVNHDVLWLMEVSKRLLAGGTYSNDFFENNPPLILYLYMPPVLMAKHFLINPILSLRIYIFFLAFLSLAICCFLIKKIFSKQDTVIANLFTLVLMTVLLLFPLYDFGQREHLLLIFTMPYFLLVVSRLQNQSIHLMLAIFIGLMAGLGFAIKPFFLAALMLVELYFILCKKNLLAWIRTENIAILISLLLYTMLVYFCYADYLHIVAPYAMRWGFLSAGAPWDMLATALPILFCYFTFIFYFFQYPTNSYHVLSTILALAMLGFLTSYFIQQTLYTYHMLPAISFAMLLSALLFCLCVVKDFKKREYMELICLGVLILAFLCHYCWAIFSVLVFVPQSYFYFFTALFVILFYLLQDKRDILAVCKTFIFIALMMGIGFLFSHIMERTSWYSYNFFATTGLLIMLFGLFAPKAQKPTQDSILIALIGGLIFAFPYYYAVNFYYMQLAKQENQNKVIHYLQTHAAHHSVYSFTTLGFFPMVNYAGNMTYVSRFSSFWMLPELVRASYLYGENYRKQQKMADKNFLIDMIADDLEKNKPDLVFVDIGKFKHNLFNFKKNHGHYDTEEMPFEYLTYFLTNEHFKSAWKAYHYVDSLNAAGFLSTTPKYQFAIYKRQNKV